MNVTEKKVNLSDTPANLFLTSMAACPLFPLIITMLILFIPDALFMKITQKNGRLKTLWPFLTRMAADFFSHFFFPDAPVMNVTHRKVT